MKPMASFFFFLPRLIFLYSRIFLNTPIWHLPFRAMNPGVSGWTGWRGVALPVAIINGIVGIQLYCLRVAVHCGSVIFFFHVVIACNQIGDRHCQQRAKTCQVWPTPFNPRNYNNSKKVSSAVFQPQTWTRVNFMLVIESLQQYAVMGINICIT